MQSLSLAVLAAILIAAPWWSPSTLFCAVAGWGTAAALVFLAQQKKHAYRRAYMAGVLIHPFAFYWLWNTIAEFGGFSLPATFAIFSLFALLSPLQFLLFVFVVRNLPQFFQKAGISTASAWFVSEVLSIRIFPWNLGHTQIAFTPFAQLAELGGSLLLSFVMLWIAELTLSRDTSIFCRRLCISTILIFVLGFGLMRSQEIERELSDLLKENDGQGHISVALTQGNIGLHDKHNPDLSEFNVRKYFELSRPYFKPDSLILWPETVVMDWIYAGLGNAQRDKRLPVPLNGAALITGAPSFQDKEHMYNSALAILSDGKMPSPYHKQILMPFGEYTPFGELFPWIKEINASAGDFARGVGPQLLQIPSSNSNNVKVAALICYEDVVPELSARAAREGAEILANMTNDAWFGKSIAPLQHHLIASFRTIETRRYLLRATNTGLTAIVDPLGRTISQLPIYTEGVLSAEVALLRRQTLYSSLLQHDLPRLLALFLLALALVLRIRRP